MSGAWAQRLLHFGLLRSASLLVPRRQREEWWREWRGELWHVRRACHSSGSNAGHADEVTAFCLGAFQDALCLRRSGRGHLPLYARLRGTPAECIFIFVLVLAASYSAALLLPGVRAERSFSRLGVSPGLVSIQRQGAFHNLGPSISSAEFSSWAARRQRFFDGMAFYTVAAEALEPASTQRFSTPGAQWQVARATINLFSIIGMPVEMVGSGGLASHTLPQVILSETIWKSRFGADPHVAGTILRLGGEDVEIAGVAPDGPVGFPGRVDAWRLGQDATRPSNGRGYMIARLSPAGGEEMWASRVPLEAGEIETDEDELIVASMNEWEPAPSTLYLFALFLALLSLPAITSVSLGESSLNPPETLWPEKIQRWSFLFTKIALLLPVVYFLSLDLAYSCTSFARESQAYLQLVTTFGLGLFTLRWILKDQRQRCPICLRRVAHPAQVGQASRTFLDWNGTEMMCMRGHTLLHVPGLPTSWFGSQRWLYLDTSWGFLFAGSTQPLP